MDNYKAKLLEKIQNFASGQISIEEFWKDFHFYWTDVPENALTNYDTDFFTVLNEKLHYTDWESPPDPALIDPSIFTLWVRDNLPLYLKGTWKK